jgi:hypothetical protein
MGILHKRICELAARMGGYVNKAAEAVRGWIRRMKSFCKG